MSDIEYSEYIKSSEWKNKRDKRLDFAVNRCEVCYRKSGLTVHHRTYERLGNERLKDMVVLCQKCHEVFHNRLALHSPEEVPDEVQKPRETLAGESTDEKRFPSTDPIPTGFDTLDEVIGGLLPSTLNVVGGRPRMGVSDFAQDIALAVSDESAVAYFSTRASTERISQKLLASLTEIPEQNIIAGNLSEDQRLQLSQASEKLEERNIQIYESPEITLGELQEESASVNRYYDLDLIVIDQIEDIRYPPVEDRWRDKQYPHLLRKIRGVSHSTGSPVLISTQIGREVYDREYRDPRMKDLHVPEFGAQSDISFLVHRPEEYGINLNIDGHSTEGIAEVYVNSERLDRNLFGEFRYDGSVGTFDRLSEEERQQRSQENESESTEDAPF